MSFGGPLGGGNWYGTNGPYGAYPGCGCSSFLMVIAGIFLIFAGLLRGCNM
jgi:hypothetical protein